MKLYRRWSLTTATTPTPPHQNDFSRVERINAMNVRRTAVSVAAAALLCLGFASSPASAQTIRVATVNPARVFLEMQETKDLRQKVEQETTNINNDGKTRLQKVKDLQAARDLLKQDSPQYAQAEQAFMQEAIQFDTWQKMTQATMGGQQKQQLKTLFDKIVAASAAEAQAQGIDLVLADQRPELPENLGGINVEQLRDRLNGRNVLFSGPKVD